MSHLIYCDLFWNFIRIHPRTHQKAVVEDDVEESGDVRDWRTRTDQPPQQTGSKNSDSWEQQAQQPSKTVAPPAPSAVGEVSGTLHLCPLNHNIMKCSIRFL